jgi:hypothetical protein
MICAHGRHGRRRLLTPAQSRSRSPRSTFTTFTTSGHGNGATGAALAATVRMQSLRFRGSITLSTQGVVRVENRDGIPHFAIASRCATA